MTKRFLRAATGLLCASLAAAALAQGAAKPLRIVVSYPPAGPVDFVARALSEQPGKELQTTVVIDNKAGAIRASEVMRSTPDGSTIWITSAGAAAVNSSLYEQLAYDM